jgi:DNA polymerase V
MAADLDSKIKQVIPISTQNVLEIPFFLPGVAAGFPSPAEIYLEDNLDLNKYLIKHPAATFFVIAEGSSMIDKEISSGDLLIVDRSLTPKNNDVVVAAVDGELIVKQIVKKGDQSFLKSANPSIPLFEITEDSDLCIWGVVTWNLHKQR